jgi:hypothetical protein
MAATICLFRFAAKICIVRKDFPKLAQLPEGVNATLFFRPGNAQTGFLAAEPR